MSVSSTDNQVIYTGSGTTGPFDFTFRIFETTDLVVQKLTIETEAIVTLTETTDYTVTIDGEVGGDVTLVASLSSAYKLIITRVLPLTQDIDYVENDPFPAESHEEGLDRGVMIDQQLQEQIDRCIIATPGTDVPTIEDINDAVADAEAAQAAAEAAVALIPENVLGDGTVNPTNLLFNGDFECWSAGTSVAPDGWTLTGSGASVARDSDDKVGSYSAKVTRSGADCSLYQRVISPYTGGFDSSYWNGRTVTFGCWVKTNTANRARLYIVDGVGSTASSFHTGDSTWQWLTVTRTLDASATYLEASCYIMTGDGEAYYDGAICVEGASAFAFSPKPAEEGVWADFSARSTIVGWTSFATKSIFVKKIGKTVFVSFYISGVSNDANTTFTLPYTAAAGITNQGACRIQDNTGATATGLWSLGGGASMVGVYSSMAAANWTASGDKQVIGQFFYEAA